MKITTTTGDMILEGDATPSNDDMNDIISSLTNSGSEFQALCDASAHFPDDLTNEQFEAECKKWLSSK